MEYLLGIDFGGGASKATLLDRLGRIVCENTVDYPTLHPTPDACEQDPGDWIAALCTNCRQILEKSAVDPGEILAVAIDSATHTFVPCDENAVPLRPAIHWTDSRSKKEAAELDKEFGSLLSELTYHRPSTIWTLPQLVWLRRNEPDVFRKTAMLFFEKDYIRHFLTGIYCTDFIEAEGSMLFDCRSLRWSQELCDIAQLPLSLLPPVVKPTDVIGAVTSDAASATGLKQGTNVICGTTDTVMEIFASGCVETGDMTVKLATAGRICCITGAPFPDRHLVNYSHIVPGLWYPGTATKAAASSFRWYKDTFGQTYQALDQEAAAVPAGAEGLYFHPYINGELTPLASPSACGSFVGIRSMHQKAHFTRAVLEGVSYSLLDSLNYMRQLGVPYNTEKTATLIGGGSKSILWSQITSNVLGIPLRITESSDSSLGSAMLAGIAAGVFENAAAAARQCLQERRVVRPDPALHSCYAEWFREYKRIQMALVPIYENRL